MKRIIALSLVLVIALACIPFSAFATPSSNAVYSKMTAARDKVYGEKQSFSAAESYDFWIYLKADGNPDAFKDAYVQSVKDAVSNETIGDAANCALAILCLQKLGFNPAEFSLGDTTVNLFEVMNSKGKDISSPYLYRYIFEAGASDALISDCVDELNKTYVAGVGNDPWGYGYSCDTNASLGVCYATNEVDYDKAEDMANTLSAYKLEDGYFSDNMWTTVANVDSTACALCLFSYMGEIEKADEAYAFLANFAVEGEEGAYFASYDPGNFNAYGTRDALLGLVEYYKLVASLPHEHNFVAQKVPAKANALGYTYYKCACGETKKDAKGNLIKDNFINPTGKVSGLKCTARTAAAEKFTWNKVSGVTGYEIQLFNSANKLVKSQILTGNTYVFTGLSAGQVYKARVRFYIKAEDGNYYGSSFTSLLVSPTLPKATKLNTVSSAKKAINAKWFRVSGVTGYQVQCSTNAKFTSSKLGAVKGANKYSLSVKGLKGGTRYFVRVRTFKTIGGKNYYSTWSAAKTVTTKK